MWSINARRPRAASEAAFWDERSRTTVVDVAAGATGIGKELVARAIHDPSERRRRSSRWIAVRSSESRSTLADAPTYSQLRQPRWIARADSIAFEPFTDRPRRGHAGRLAYRAVAARGIAARVLCSIWTWHSASCADSRNVAARSTPSAHPHNPPTSTASMSSGNALSGCRDHKNPARSNSHVASALDSAPVAPSIAVIACAPVQPIGVQQNRAFFVVGDHRPPPGATIDHVLERLGFLTGIQRLLSVIAGTRERAITDA